VQSTEFIGDFIQQAKTLGFKSINIELIYGLPHQILERFAKILVKAYQWDVKGISLFSYAYILSHFAAQRKLRNEWLTIS
jgi:oxygen-independent coproporphyrinogen-3 oxidase